MVNNFIHGELRDSEEATDGLEETVIEFEVVDRSEERSGYQFNKSHLRNHQVQQPRPQPIVIEPQHP